MSIYVSLCRIVPYVTMHKKGFYQQAGVIPQWVQISNEERIRYEGHSRELLPLLRIQKLKLVMLHSYLPRISVDTDKGL